jgi:hypothetical protein
VTGLAEIQRAFTRVCFDRTPREDDLALLHADRERWLMYRRMVRERLYGMMRAGLPKTTALLGPDAFDDAASRYLAEEGPRSRYIRDVVPALASHALPRWEADAELPAHLCDLARYEVAKWRAASLEWEVEDARELDFEAVPVFNPSVCVVTLRHRVDKLSESHAIPAVLAEPHHALVYRKPASPRVFTYVLNDMGGRLVAAWRGGGSCADGARAVLAELGREPDARFIDGMAGILADLIAQKILLGSRR